MKARARLNQKIRQWIRSGLLAAVCLNFGSVAHADIALQWQNTEMDERQQLLAEFLNDSHVMTDLLSLLQENFVFEPALKFVIGSADGPLFDNETHTIRFPYSYVSAALEAQMNLLDEGQTAVDRSINLVAYTLYHLVAHAMVAADSPEDDEQLERIASWLMIRGFENGAEQMVSNAQAYGSVSQKIDGPQEDYWHSHSLIASRQREMECWALGFDHVVIEPLLDSVLEPAKRVQHCQAAWNQVDRQVQAWLADSLKADAPIINE